MEEEGVPAGGGGQGGTGRTLHNARRPFPPQPTRSDDRVHAGDRGGHSGERPGAHLTARPLTFCPDDAHVCVYVPATCRDEEIPAAPRATCWQKRRVSAGCGRLDQHLKWDKAAVSQHPRRSPLLCVYKLISGLLYTMHSMFYDGPRCGK